MAYLSRSTSRPYGRAAIASSQRLRRLRPPSIRQRSVSSTSQAHGVSSAIVHALDSERAQPLWLQPAHCFWSRPGSSYLPERRANCRRQFGLVPFGGIQRDPSFSPDGSGWAGGRRHRGADPHNRSRLRQLSVHGRARPAARAALPVMRLKWRRLRLLWDTLEGEVASTGPRP